jgi:hypothetical protein
MWEIEVEVTEDINPYRKLVEKFGREKKETPIPSPYGAVSLKEWDNGITLVRKVEYDFGRKMYVMKDRVCVPERSEFGKLIEELESIRIKR